MNFIKAPKEHVKIVANTAALPPQGRANVLYYQLDTNQMKWWNPGLSTPAYEILPYTFVLKATDRGLTPGDEKNKIYATDSNGNDILIDGTSVGVSKFVDLDEVDITSAELSGGEGKLVGVDNNGNLVLVSSSSQSGIVDGDGIDITVNGSGDYVISIEDGGVTEDKIADGAVTSDKIDDGAVTEDKIADGVITHEKMDEDAIDSNNIIDEAVTGEKIAEDAISSMHIEDDAIYEYHINDDAVTSIKIEDDAVITAKIEDGAVTSEKIDEYAVTTEKIGNMAVTNAKLADDAVETDNILDEAVTGNKIAEKTILSDHIADGEILNSKLAPMGAYTIKGNGESSTDSPTDLSVEDVKMLLGLSEVMRYKGSYPTLAALYAENTVYHEVGDVYNIENDDAAGTDGNNYAFKGTPGEHTTTSADWDKLGGTIDLSGYLKTSDATTGNDNNKVVKRTASAQINVPAIPTDANNATSKSYVDSLTKKEWYVLDFRDDNNISFYAPTNIKITTELLIIGTGTLTKSYTVGNTISAGTEIIITASNNSVWKIEVETI